MFSGKITTTCSIGVAAAGNAAVSGDDALDIEMPSVAAPRASTATSAAKTCLRVRKVDSPLASLGGHWHGIAPLPPRTRRYAHAARGSGADMSPAGHRPVVIL